MAYFLGYILLGWILTSGFMFFCQFEGENTCLLLGWLKKSIMGEITGTQAVWVSSSIIFPAYKQENIPVVCSFNLSLSRAHLEFVKGRLSWLEAGPDSPDPLLTKKAAITPTPRASHERHAAGQGEVRGTTRLRREAPILERGAGRLPSAPLPTVKPTAPTAAPTRDWADSGRDSVGGRARRRQCVMKDTELEKRKEFEFKLS